MSNNKINTLVDEEYIKTLFSIFKKQNAEITLYHSGHALVLIDEKSVFDGDLIEKRNPIAKLSYYNIDDGEKISLH